MLTIKEHSSAYYGPRTFENAKAAELTVAFAVDYTTKGEALTHKAAGDRYFAIPLDMPADEAARSLYKELRQRNAHTLNIAGNGIYTLAQHGWSQGQVNSHLFQVLAKVHEHWPLTSIRSGGQTGVDLAGLVVGQALGIETTGLLPKGYIQRTEDKKDRQYSREHVEQQVVTGANALQGRKEIHSEIGSVRVVSKRQGGSRAESDETIIDGDRNSAVFGNRHFLKDWQDPAERDRVIAKHRTEDYGPDVLAGGPMYQEMKNIAGRVQHGEKIAIACWCAPLKCHCDHIADGIRKLAAGVDLQAEMRAANENQKQADESSARSTDIRGFQGEFRWLSNFWPAKVELDGVTYPTVEHAYQASKTWPADRVPFYVGTPYDAKRLGKTIPIRTGWQDEKIAIMESLIQQKFAPGSSLANKLVETNDAPIIEANTWGDKFWGVCNGEGQNHLGKILMECREKLMCSKPANDAEIVSNQQQSKPSRLRR